MESELAKLNRNQLSRISYDNMKLRYNKHILPFFGLMDVLSINYKTLDEFLQKISNQEPKFSVSKLSAYMGLTRKVLQHAARHSFIEHISEFPKVGVEDKPRGWFNVGEYKEITKQSKKLACKRVVWRAHTEPMEGSYFCAPDEKISPTDRLINRIESTKDLSVIHTHVLNFKLTKYH